MAVKELRALSQEQSFPNEREEVYELKKDCGLAGETRGEGLLPGLRCGNFTAGTRYCDESDACLTCKI